jgi:hemerythrin-like domain-containing protein
VRKNEQRDALERLERSHGRLLEEAEALCAAVEQSAPREELEQFVTFFERQGYRHEIDEEKSLFPRLRGKVPDALLKELTSQHREHERLCARLRELIEQPSARAELAAQAHLLRDHYRTHIALEDAQLLPAARSVLTAEDLAAMDDEMQSRRGR